MNYYFFRMENKYKLALQYYGELFATIKLSDKAKFLLPLKKAGLKIREAKLLKFKFSKDLWTKANIEKKRGNISYFHFFFHIEIMVLFS